MKGSKGGNVSLGVSLLMINGSQGSYSHRSACNILVFKFFKPKIHSRFSGVHSLSVDFSGPLFVFSSCFLLAIVFSIPLGI